MKKLLIAGICAVMAAGWFAYTNNTETETSLLQPPKAGEVEQPKPETKAKTAETETALQKQGLSIQNAAKINLK